MTAAAVESVRGMRIAHLIETDGPGGAERMVAHLATAFERQGCPGVVVLPAHGEGWLASQLEGSGVTIEHLEIAHPLSPRAARRLAAMLRAHRIDVVHSHEFTMGVYGAWASRAAGLPHVITMHGGRYYAERWRRRVALRLAIRASGGVVAVSCHAAQALAADLALHARDVAVIPNGICPEPANAPALQRELGLRDTDVILLSVGNLYPVKGHTHLLTAVAELLPAHPEVHVAIAGRGEMEAALRLQADALGVASHVHLLGFRRDTANLLAAADVFVLPSLSEGLPLALLEAMFAGLPVVATDVGDVSTVLAGTGVVVPPADGHRLAEAIAGMLECPHAARQLGAAGRQRAREEYGLEQAVERYAELYAARAARQPR
ncbi:MAG TPA: glycosyltransferase [Gemmatimonadaceae bacterium]|nr:glycosyltransferase [Gemmatimonadaceae bacterium]